jgi:CheY-like chemotaxis protein
MSPPVHRAVVFVAEDDDDLRDGMQGLLEDEGFLVLGARNGAEALARMRGISGSAIAVIDLVMPGMDGWELIAAMRGDAELKRVPIIVVSGQRDRKPISGVDRIFEKPCAATELVRAVKELCGVT